MQLKKIQDNHWWFINNVSGFKDPNTMSRLALDSPGISIGEHQLSVNADLKEVALTVSLILVPFSFCISLVGMGIARAGEGCSGED